MRDIITLLTFIRLGTALSVFIISSFFGELWWGASLFLRRNSPELFQITIEIGFWNGISSFLAGFALFGCSWVSQQSGPEIQSGKQALLHTFAELGIRLLYGVFYFWHGGWCKWHFLDRIFLKLKFEIIINYLINTWLYN